MNTDRFEVVDGVARLDVKGGIFQIDEEDMHHLDYGIFRVKGGYPLIRKPADGRMRQFTVSRMIMNPNDDMVVDHINHDTLDNRRSNLRVCTHRQNAQNKRLQSGRRTGTLKGAYKVSDKYISRYAERPWRSGIKVDGKRIWLGYYATELEAAQAYNEAAKAHFGEYAWLNDVG